MAEKRRAILIFWSLVTAFALFGLIWGLADPTRFERYKAVAQSHILPLGVAGMVLFVGIQALQVVITPISHYVVGAIGGFLYGPILGGVLNYIGRIIGHACAFFIARRFKGLAKRFVGSDTMARYDRIFSGEVEGRRSFTPQHLMLFLFYFLPLFPDDEISYLVGLSSMRWTPFILANLFGHLGGAFSLSYIGSGINTKDWLFWVLTFATLVGFVALWVVYYVHGRKPKARTGQA